MGFTRMILKKLRAVNLKRTVFILNVFQGTCDIDHEMSGDGTPPSFKDIPQISEILININTR